VPARHDDQPAGVFGKPRAPVVSKPVPYLVTVALALSFGTTLDRVIYHTEVELHSVNRAVDRGVAK
jgi:hypothetical protein